MSGESTFASVILRSLMPIAGATILSIPLLLRLFAADIDRIESQRKKDVIAPIVSHASLRVDRDIAESKFDLDKLLLERAEVARKQESIISAFDLQDAEMRRRKFEADKRLEDAALLLSCEADGSRCATGSSGKAGLSGPVSNRARHVLAAATAEASALKEELDAAEGPLRRRLGPVSERLSQLDSAQGASSISQARSRWEGLFSDRDILIAARVSADPAVKDTAHVDGVGERTLLLVAIILERPVVLALVLAAKVFVTAFELLGLLRGIQFAHGSQERRFDLESRRSQVHGFRLAQVRRRTEMAIAKIFGRQETWSARRSIANERAFERAEGIRTQLRRHFGKMK